MDYAFDPTGVTPNFGGGPGLPVGKHPVTITKSEGKPTQDNTGGYIELTCTAFDGPAKGGSIAIRLNVHNKSEAAVRIAKEQLAAICAVTGVGPFQNTQALHDKAFVVDVGPQKDKPQYTEVIGVFDMQGNEPGKAQPGGGANTGGGFGGNAGGNTGGGFGGGATATGNVPDQQQQNGQQQGNGGFGGNAGGGAGTGAGGGNGWQQGGGGGGTGTGGGSPGWGAR